MGRERASRILSRSLLISLAIILIFSSSIFLNLNVGIQCVLRCKAMGLESLSLIVSRLQIPETLHIKKKTTRINSINF